MAIGLVMEVHSVRLRMHVACLGDERLDSFEVRECFHAELAVEPSTQRLKNLILLLRSVPDVPLVHIADSRVRRDLAVAPRAAWMVDRSVALLMHDLGQKLFVRVASREVGFEPRLRVLVRVVVLELALLLHLVVLIVSRPENYRGVVAHAADVGDCFLSD